jgi:hypothetical protein
MKKRKKLDYWKLSAITLLTLLICVLVYQYAVKNQDKYIFGNIEIPKMQLHTLAEKYPAGQQFQLCELDTGTCVYITRQK